MQKIPIATLLGIAIAIIIAIWREKHRGKLTCYLHHAIPLLNATGSVDGIRMEFRGATVDAALRGLVVTRVAVVNDGWKDISKKLVHASLRLLLPDDCYWLSASPLPPNKPEARCTVSGDAVTIDFELLQPNDYVNVDLLASVGKTDETQPASRVFRELDVDSHIENTRPARLVRLEDQNAAVLRLKMCALFLGATILALAEIWFCAIPASKSGSAAWWGSAALSVVVACGLILAAYKTSRYYWLHLRFKKLQQITGNFGDFIPPKARRRV